MSDTIEHDTAPPLITSDEYRDLLQEHAKQQPNPDDPEDTLGWPLGLTLAHGRGDRQAIIERYGDTEAGFEALVMLYAGQDEIEPCEAEAHALGKFVANSEFLWAIVSGQRKDDPERQAFALASRLLAAGVPRGIVEHAAKLTAKHRGWVPATASYAVTRALRCHARG